MFTYEVEIATCAVFLGCLLRLLLPYLERRDSVTFDNKYIPSFVGSFVLAFVQTTLIVANLQIPDTAGPKILLFFTMFLEGWGTSDVINKLGIDWRKEK